LEIFSHNHERLEAVPSAAGLEKVFVAVPAAIEKGLPTYQMICQVLFG
jgi:hypothetical protein